MQVTFLQDDSGRRCIHVPNTHSVVCPPRYPPLQFTFLQDDWGIPLNYRHMEGFGVSDDCPAFLISCLQMGVLLRAAVAAAAAGAATWRALG